MTVLIAKVFLTLATLGYSAIPAIFDSNATHMTNPTWVGHARFHVVWQVASYICFAAIALCLIWIPGEAAVGRMWLAAAMAASAYIGFFSAVMGCRFYGGAHYDPNGVVPVQISILGRLRSFEVNITLFTIAAALLSIGVLFLASASFA